MKHISEHLIFFIYFQLVNGHTLFDYNVGLNDLIQLMVRPKVPVAPKEDLKQLEYESGGEDTSSNSSDKENTIVSFNVAFFSQSWVWVDVCIAKELTFHKMNW